MAKMIETDPRASRVKLAGRDRSGAAERFWREVEDMFTSA